MFDRAPEGLGKRILCSCRARAALAPLSEGALQNLFLPCSEAAGLPARGNSCPCPSRRAAVTQGGQGCRASQPHLALQTQLSWAGLTLC